MENGSVKRLVTDVEADGLNPTRIWCIVTLDIDTDEVQIWRYDQSSDVDLNDNLLIGHHILGYDINVLNKLFVRNALDHRLCIDTLVCSRLFDFARVGGHSLESWGRRLGLPKGEFDEWESYSDPDRESDRMDRCVAYCIQDCRIAAGIFRFYEKNIYSEQWRLSLRVEHDIAKVCSELHQNGFKFNQVQAVQIQSELRRTLDELSDSLSRAFLPRTKLIREIVPKATKFGTIHRGDFRWDASGDLSAFSPGAPFSRFEYVPFNPASPDQVVARLSEVGWQPTEKTDGYKDAEKELRGILRSSYRNRGRKSERQIELEKEIAKYKVSGWKISEENLATLPETPPVGVSQQSLEACKILVKYRMLAKRLQTLEEWLEAYNPETKGIHGNFHGIGTWTHRMAHSDPNMGNTPSIDSKYHAVELKSLAKTYGLKMRGCWTSDPRNVLVGVDADSIQLRILAHYMNDPEFIEALVNGVKNEDLPEESTDAHSLNALKLGYNSKASGRPRAKTWIYAWLLGAGVDKSAKILGCSHEESRFKIDSFIRGYPGLRRLKLQAIPADALRGYFEGFDGRLIKTDEYHMLAGYLQTGEACIMKHATILWHDRLRRASIPFKLVNFVHDEWQTSVLPQYAQYVADVQKQSIKDVGETFELNCPFAGSQKIGKTWMDTH